MVFLKLIKLFLLLVKLFAFLNKSCHVVLHRTLILLNLCTECLILPSLALQLLSEATHLDLIVSNNTLVVLLNDRGCVDDSLFHLLQILNQFSVLLLQISNSIRQGTESTILHLQLTNFPQKLTHLSLQLEMELWLGLHPLHNGCLHVRHLPKPLNLCHQPRHLLTPSLLQLSQSPEQPGILSPQPPILLMRPDHPQLPLLMQFLHPGLQHPDLPVQVRIANLCDLDHLGHTRWGHRPVDEDVLGRRYFT